MYVSASSSKSLDAGLSFATFSRCVASARTAERLLDIHRSVGPPPPPMPSQSNSSPLSRATTPLPREAGCLGHDDRVLLRTAALGERVPRASHAGGGDFPCFTPGGEDGEVFVCFNGWFKIAENCVYDERANERTN